MKKHSNDYEYWSKRAEVFDKASCNINGKCTRDGKGGWVISQFRDTDIALEMGCGTGIYSALIADKVKKLVVTDMSREMLELAKTKLNQYNNVEVSKEDCYHTSFEDNTFDSVLLANLIHVVTDPTSVMKESRRVLKKGGRIVVIDYTFYNMSLMEKLGEILRYLRDFGLPPSPAKSLSPEDLTKISDEAGFVVEESKLVGDKLKAVCLRGIKTE
jgi:ABC-2 type transport system ATP-binding protein